MKFQCDACERLVPLEVFRVEAGMLVVTCGRCGAEGRVQVSAAQAQAQAGTGGASAPPPDAAPPLPPARPSSPSLRVVRGADTPPPSLSDMELFEPPPGCCPKCVAPRREGSEACAQCGLVFANYLEDEHRPSDVLAGAWRELAAHWEDAGAHERLLTLAMGRGELAMVGRLYRLRLARAPEDAVARQGRDEVVRRAAMVVPLAAERSGPATSARRAKGVAVGVMFLVVLVLSAVIFRYLRELMAGP